MAIKQVKGAKIRYSLTQKGLSEEVHGGRPAVASLAKEMWFLILNKELCSRNSIRTPTAPSQTTEFALFTYPLLDGLSTG